MDFKGQSARRRRYSCGHAGGQMLLAILVVTAMVIGSVLAFNTLKP